MVMIPRGHLQHTRARPWYTNAGALSVEMRRNYLLSSLNDADAAMRVARTNMAVYKINNCCG